VITLDTSALIALLDRKDRDHERVLGVIGDDRGPYVVPSGILSEITYFVETRLGAGVLDAFLGDLQSGAFVLDCGEEDLPRIRELVSGYADLPLGFADASVVACGERSGGRVLTLDERDFRVVAGEGRIEVLP
jgi:predicted nucleic acid-binding protein